MQSFLVAFDVNHNHVGKLEAIVGKVILAGGCLWQRQEPDVRNRVLNGLTLAQAAQAAGPTQ